MSNLDKLQWGMGAWASPTFQIVFIQLLCTSAPSSLFACFFHHCRLHWHDSVQATGTISRFVENGKFGLLTFCVPRVSLCPRKGRTTRQVGLRVLVTECSTWVQVGNRTPEPTHATESEKVISKPAPSCCKMHLTGTLNGRVFPVEWPHILQSLFIWSIYTHAYLCLVPRTLTRVAGS